MIYVDTSFLFALFVEQDHSDRASKWMDADARPLWVTSFGIFEFEQALRLQMFLFRKDRNRGLKESSAHLAFNHLRSQLKQGVFVDCDYEWKAVLKEASRLSVEHTDSKGCRSMDVLHVALALHLGALEFLTFDANQKKLLAGLLAIFLGNLGIHKFILGYNTAGIIMIALNLTCIGAPVIRIISLIEGIMYLVKSDEEFYNTYLANRREWF